MPAEIKCSSKKSVKDIVGTWLVIHSIPAKFSGVLVLVGLLVFAVCFVIYDLRLVGFVGFMAIVIGILAKIYLLNHSLVRLRRVSAMRKYFCDLLLLPNSFVRLLFFELASSPINAVLDFTGVLLLSGAVAITFLVHKKIETITMSIFVLTVLLDLSVFAFFPPAYSVFEAGFVAMSFASLMAILIGVRIKTSATVQARGTTYV